MRRLWQGSKFSSENRIFMILFFQMSQKTRNVTLLMRQRKTNRVTVAEGFQEGVQESVHAQSQRDENLNETIGKLHEGIENLSQNVKVVANAQAEEPNLAVPHSDFMLPTLLGNIIGGVLLVAMLNFGPVAAEKIGNGES